ncbi:MAG: hypothetical protein NVSMB64_00400 [Candidatus Velthaea sp.]
MDGSAEATAALDRLVDRVMLRDQGDYGYEDSLVPTLRAGLTAMGTQDFRFTIVDQLTAGGRTRILDLGCGTAPFVLSAIARGYDAVGIDTDLEKIAIAHRKIAAYALPPDWKSRIALGDATSLDFPSESFDVVTNEQVLEHIPDVSSALYEAVRVTKRGGHLFFSAPDYRNSYEPHYRMPWPRFAPPWVAHRWVMAMGRPPGGIGTFFYISMPQIALILQALGCEIVHAAVSHPDIAAESRPMFFKREDEIADYAAGIRERQMAGALEPHFTTVVTFQIVARRR